MVSGKEIKIIVSAALSLGLILPALPSQAKVLQGNVQQEDMRLDRQQQGFQGQAQQGGNGMRIARTATQGPLNGGLVDVGAFSPLKGGAEDNGGKLGIIQPAQFGKIPNSKFDLGADRNSQELVLAWEKWHHQFSEAVYTRWSEIASTPGRATLKITVSRNKIIQAEVVRSSGSPRFDRELIQSIYSLNNNPGLTFPTKSQRDHVTMEADYIADTNVEPGYSWVKNDYEKVHNEY